METRHNRWWWTEFDFSGGRVRVPRTGADLKLDWLLVTDALRWMTYFVLVVGASIVSVARRAPGPRLYFTPEWPRPWYIIWAASVWAGLRFARNAEAADASVYFSDTTTGVAPPALTPLYYNARCPDVSKSRVAVVFEQVFGYPLSIDPRQHQGLCVEKSETNGRHDGKLIQCPAPAQPGMTYQKFIDTSIDGVARDLRTPCVAGRPVIVMVKMKPANESFSIQNTSVRAVEVASAFTPGEIDLIGRFNEAMGLDWGSLDILRERGTGRLYIVDANKTDVGPPVVLSWRDRIRVTGALATALRAMVERDVNARPRAS